MSGYGAGAARALAALLVGRQQGAQQKRQRTLEDDERAEARRRQQVAEFRQRQLDEAAAAERAREAALEPVQLAARGVFRGAAPATPPTLAMPTEALGVGFLDNGVTPHPDAGRYVQAGEYFLDQEQTPEHRAAQRTLAQRAADARARMEEERLAAAERAKAIAETARHNRAMEGNAARTAAAAETRAVRAGQPRQLPTRPAPIAAVQTVLDNEKSLGVIDDALAHLEKNPDAVGSVNAIPGATWVRNHVTGTDEDVNTRASIADIGSLTIRDRSGAAVSAAEFPRIRPFIPSETDTPQAARVKLARMRQIIAEENALYLANFGPDQGYLPIRTSAPGTRPAPTGGKTGLRETPAPGARQRDPVLAKYGLDVP